MMESISTDIEEIKLISEDSNEEINEDITLIKICINKVISSFILTLSILIIFLDLYISFIDDSCINKYMKIYLYISSALILLLLLIYVFNKYIIKTLILYYYLIKVILYFYIFIIIGFIVCTIIGSIIFWNIIDRRNCTNFIDKYLYVSLIIKNIVIFYLFYKKFFIV